MQNFFLFTVIQYVNVHLPSFLTSGSVNYKLFCCFVCMHKKAVIRFECFHSIGLPLLYNSVSYVN